MNTVSIPQAKKISPSLQAAKQAESFGLIHPHDRNGKTIADRHCSVEVEKAMDDYRKACDKAHAAVRHQMQELSKKLQVSLSLISGFFCKISLKISSV